MAYRAEIEIGVKGTRQLEELRSKIAATSNAVNILNQVLAQTGGTAQTLRTFSRTLAEASSNLKDVTAGMFSETQAIREYVTALGQANSAQARQNRLITEEIEARRKAGLARAGIRERTQYAGPIGPGPASPVGSLVGQKSPVEEKIRRTIAGQQEQLVLEAALLKLEQKSAAVANQELEARAEIARITARNVNAAKLAATRQQFPVEGPITAEQFGSGQRRAARAGLASNFGKRLPGAVSGSIIGGAFPLLFGQGGGAAAGGFAGGLVGGLMGPGGSFAGSLLGTLLGDIASQGQKIKQLGTDIGFSAQQANVLADGFKKANTDIEKFTGVVQNIRGLGLELESQAELIKLTTTLTEKYGGQFDKVGNAITSALESGKVSQGTLNQLTSQGVNIQQALADKLGVSKDQLLEMAKKGKIDIQDLVDTLVDMGNKGVEATKKPASGMEQLGKAAQGLGTAIGDLGAAIMKTLKPALDWLAGTLAGIIGLATRAVNAMANMLSGGTAETALANARARERLAAEGGPSVGTRYVAQKYQKRLEELQKEEQAKVVVTPDSKVKPIDVSSLGRAPSSGGGGGTDKAEKAAAREAARVAELVREQRLITLEYQKQQEIGTKIFAAEMARDPMLVRRLQGEQQLAEWGVKTANLLEKESSTAGKLAIAKAQQAEQAVIRQKIEQDMARIEKERKDRFDDIVLDLDLELKLRTATTEEARRQLRIENEIAKLRKAGLTEEQLKEIEKKRQQASAPLTPTEEINQRIGKLKDELADLTNVGKMVITIAESIGTSFANSFKGVISGAMTAQEALSSFFQSVADRFLDMAAQIIAKWIEMTILNSIVNIFSGGIGGGGGGSMFTPSYAAFEFVPGKAAGGPVMAGSPYMVGEKGPELFVPGKSGTIVPNNALGSGGGPTNVVVNVDASGSSVQGNGNEAGQLGKVIGLAVQQELIKQKRPGGLLA